VAGFGGIDADEVLGPSRDRDRIKTDLDSMRRLLEREDTDDS
jgi:hypothetical protein